MTGPMLGLRIAAAALLSATPQLAVGQIAPAAPGWTTLGTMGGPVPSATRSQPANLLTFGGDAWLVDCGDGTAGQLAKARMPLPRVKAVLLSHLHADHSGGLGAVLALRFQANIPGRLKIYGPPGTRDLVAGLIGSLGPLHMLSSGLGSSRPPADMVEVEELKDGDRFALGQIMVTARVRRR